MGIIAPFRTPKELKSRPLESWMTVQLYKVLAASHKVRGSLRDLH